jgi:hypothetical protein
MGFDVKPFTNNSLRIFGTGDMFYTAENLQWGLSTWHLKG